MRYVVIVAGGSGKRLWPLSRQGEPKQLLELIGDKSLLRISYERVRGVVPDERILICTGADYAASVAAQVPEVPSGNILGEPVGRDSLNAVAWPAAVLAAADPEAVMAVLTADHVMRPESVFRERLDEAFTLAERVPDALVTFGVVPTSPQTGFGYLHRGGPLGLDGVMHACAVSGFTEKPQRRVAEQYLESGEYWWNSGMFVWRASALLAALAVLQPATHAQVLELAAEPGRLAEIYPQLHKVSVDYGVMEPVSRGEAPGRVVAVELPISWYDVGSFLALAGQLPTDAGRNARQGCTVVLDGFDNLVINRRSDEHVVAVSGLRSMAVVVTDRATMVAPLADAEQVKELVARVADEVGPRFA
ncbi:mannose-1-phosphate guanylyltransferase [Aestuariimicrobium kwangyangense]|uniref:mannose-1-phosphate guanylyltransferase n=1 Tax=Aestuariimicrobium kwangyangense TaxID=396389 RepID=UPI0003B77E0D|nr:mannose-1-phosphate guanylyltransferase [Aestuariimicrobium kwangyangense]